MFVDSLLNYKASFQNDTWSIISKELTIQEVLWDIKSNKLENKILQLRSSLTNGDVDKYNLHKKTLPCVTFCGTFDGSRKREKITSYNNIVVIDIDKLSTDELPKVKSILAEDKYVFSFWESPSGLGLKGLVYITYQFNINDHLIDNLHKSAFNKLFIYFRDTFNILLDESGSDTTRLCFLSFDTALVLKKECTAFEVNKDDLFANNPILKGQKSNLLATYISSKDKLFNPKQKNQPFHRKQIQSIIKFLEKRDLSITSTYEHWYRVAYSVSNTFTYDIGLKYYLSLCKLDSGKYDEVNCKNMLNYCYEHSLGEITFSTIMFLAKEKGYKVLSQRSEVSKTAF